MAGVSSESSASERAYQVIRNGILDHTHVPGTMLGEAALAADLGVSRTPVRVALARLQDEGWIVIYPKRGAQVQGLTERTVAELADARFLLESTSVERASAQMRGELAARLDASVDAQQDAFDRDDVACFIDLTLQFHRGFVEVSGNRVLLELYGQLVDRHRFLLFGSKGRLLARAAHIIAEHVQLIEELRNGDAPGFARALRDHIAETNATSIDMFGRAGVPPIGRS